MIARIWRGVTKAEDAEEYETYIEEAGFAERTKRRLLTRSL